jgi:crotonobetainyl-CoA:carnitine CoA-transferase CaiB-like acyl-CoA transferase
VTGSADEPAKAGCSIADIAAGMYAYSSILAALIARGRSGLGRRIDVSMLESMVEWMSYPMYYAYRRRAAAAGRRRARDHLPYGPFPAGDGRIVMLGLQNEREWRLFCEQVLGQPGLADDPALRLELEAPRRPRRAARADRRRLRRLDADQVAERLERAQIANARVNDMREVWNHAQLRARERWVEVATAAGPIPALLPPGTTRADEPRMDPVPALGAHTEAILAELGYGGEDIAALRLAQAV